MVYTCEWCGDGIEVGDDYIEFDGCQYHKDCFDECAAEILFELGAYKSTAEVEG